MRLYREVLITSTEQAEGMPVGTVAHHSEADDNGVIGARWVAIKVADDEWHDTAAPGPGWLAPSTDAAIAHEGWTALVPAEAEEVRRAVELREGDEPDRIMRRYVTPWEPVP